MAPSSTGAASASSSILNSQFLNLATVDQTLTTTSDPVESINLLSAKLHVLTRTPPAGIALDSPSTSTRTSSLQSNDTQATRRLNDDIQVLRVRLDLARAFMNVPGRMIEAEAEITTALGECKRLLKRYSRPRHNDRGPYQVEKAEPRESNESIESRTSSDQPAERGNDASRDGGEYAEGLEYVKRLRTEGLRMLVEVEEALGRDGRAQRWRNLLEELTRATEGQSGSLDKG